ncbi:MAG: hypothetical protein AAGA42_10690 [Actinomycetota bacterium]
MPAIKDLNFFDLNYDRGTSWYADFFAGAEVSQVVGEVGHRYLRDATAAERIAATLQQPTILVTLREPTSYVQSDWRFVQRNGRTQLDIDHYTASEFDWSSIGYRSMLEPFVERFGVGSIAVADFSLLAADPQRYLDDVFAAIGVRPIAASLRLDSVDNPASGARLNGVARATNRASKFLKTRPGGPQAVHLAKRSRTLNRILFTRKVADTAMSAETRERIQSAAANDIAWVDSTFGTSLHRSWYGIP